MAGFDYDLFVIGAGSGGVRASRIAAGLGARVAVAEERYLGGTCVNVGCVPKKLFVYGSHFAEEFADSAAYGWQAGAAARFDWPTLRDNKTREIERLNGVYRGLLDGAGVTLFEARARIVAPHVLEVGGRQVTAAHILVATGGWPTVPAIPGAELAITSNEVFYLDTFPRRVVVVGGGYIAVEFAGIFAGLGAQVTQLYRGPMFLRGFDDGVRSFVADEIRRKGIDLRFDANPVALERSADGIVVDLGNGGRLMADCVLYATGRHPNTAGLGLEQVGVALRDDGAIVVDGNHATSVPGIHAIGDVIGHVQLTPVAIHEGMALARRLFGGSDARVDYENIPTAVFCQPSIGTVGLTEQDAIRRYGAVDIYESRFRPLKYTLSGRDERTLMKLVVARDTDRVVGVHMVGPDAGEIIQGMAVALKAGATKAVFDATVGIHPTAAEEFVTMRTPTRSL